MRSPSFTHFASIAFCALAFTTSGCDDDPTVTAPDSQGQTDNATPDTVDTDTAKDVAAETSADTVPSPSDADAEEADAAGDAAGPDISSDAAVEAETTVCSPATESVVTFETSDGETLEADFYPSGVANGPAVVLLHMIPPSNDRTNYPASFRQLLVDRGIAVLNVDRRGAGGSSGNPAEAYAGANGKFDAAAAMDFLAGADCPIDMTRVAISGASNGTTTALDYAVHAAAEPAAPSPAALVFLTGGGYTENQNTIDAQRALLEPLPMLFVYSNTESGWSVQFEPAAPTTWTFDMYSPGGHGTNMFSVQPASAAAVADWLQGALKE